MTYTARAALPFPGLRGQLRLLVSNDDRTPDWDTLRITEPVEVIGAHGRVWYEWTATVTTAE